MVVLCVQLEVLHWLRYSWTQLGVFGDIRQVILRQLRCKALLKEEYLAIVRLVRCESSGDGEILE